MAPFQPQRDLLTTTPGIGPLAAAAVISEIGVTLTGFPDDAHLASWTGLPGNHESAGKRRSGKRRKGNQHLQSILVECAWAAVRHDGYLKSLYHRHVMKWGGYRSPTAKKKAIIVVAHAMIVIIWHILATGKPYHELGADYFTTRLDPERETRRLIATLKPSATRSPSSQPPDKQAPQNPAPLTLRRVLPPAKPGTIHVSVPAGSAATGRSASGARRSRDAGPLPRRLAGFRSPVPLSDLRAMVAFGHPLNERFPSRHPQDL